MNDKEYPTLDDERRESFLYCLIDFAEAETNKEHDGYNCGNLVKLINRLDRFLANHTQAAVDAARVDGRYAYACELKKFIDKGFCGPISADIIKKYVDASIQTLEPQINQQ